MRKNRDSNDIGNKLKRMRGQLIAETNRQFRKPQCQHPLAGLQCGEVIDAHSLSRASSLTSLADATNHVLSFHPMHTPVEVPQPKSVGLNKASTFQGMCNVHDRQFAPIDNGPFDGSAVHCHLLAARAIAMECHRKSAHVRLLQRASDAAGGDDDLERMIDHGALDASDLGARLGLQDMKSIKEAVDAALVTGALDLLEYRVLRFGGKPAMAATGVFTPDFDLSGRWIQRLDNIDSECELLCLSLLPEHEATHLVFVWRRGDTAPLRFVDSLLARPPEKLARLVPQLCLGYVENCYFSHQWWNSQSVVRQERLARFARFMSTAPLPLVAHEFMDWTFENVDAPFP